MSKPKLSKYAQKVAKRNTLAAAFERVEEQKREALPEQVERKKAQPPLSPRSAFADLGEMPSKAGELLKTAAQLIKDAEAILTLCYAHANRGAQQGEVLSVLGCARATYPRIEAIARRAAHVPNVKQERGAA